MNKWNFLNKIELRFKKLNLKIKTLEMETSNQEKEYNSPNKNNQELNIKESEFNRQTLNEFDNRIRLTDSDENGLELYCYTNCTDSDNEYLQQCRGIVFNGENIVMKAFPYTIEYDHTNTEEIKEKILPNFEECNFYDAHEGALIRLFYFDNKWYISTHRKLNAFRSKWSSQESFGNQFIKAIDSEYIYNKEFAVSLPKKDSSIIERFQDTLDKNKQYMFLISHSKENRIVCETKNRPTVFHVGTFVNGELTMTENCNIPYPKKHNFSNMNELLNYVNDIDYTKLQGIIVFAPNNKQYKINHKEYNLLFNARGNEPSIKYRYLQVRLNRKLTDMLYHLYPEKINVFDDIENNIYEIVKNIYNCYVKRYIKKNFVTVPTEEFYVMRECHQWHETDRQYNRVTFNKVFEIFNGQNPTNINRMLRRYNIESTKKDVQKDENISRKRSNTLSTNPSPYVNSIINSREVSPMLLPNKEQLPVNSIEI